MVMLRYRMRSWVCFFWGLCGLCGLCGSGLSWGFPANDRQYPRENVVAVDEVVLQGRADMQDDDRRHRVVDPVVSDPENLREFLVLRQEIGYRQHAEVHGLEARGGAEEPARERRREEE